MRKIFVLTNLKDCEREWNSKISQDSIFNVWNFRNCFHKNFKRPSCFVFLENKKEETFLPLSWIREKNYLGYFPGEVWKGRTWLEQNKIVGENNLLFKSFFNFLDKKGISYDLRYLSSTQNNFSQIDETGYLFFPEESNYNLQEYFDLFPKKTIKKINKEITALENKGIEFRNNFLEDFDLLVNFNLQRYREESYFADARFLNSFRDVLKFLFSEDLLKLTTILIAGIPAAVDLGIIFKNKYTLLAGGTNPLFPGIAKLINLYHLKWACEKKINEVDFLCGNFSWKDRFRLVPRPLYSFSNIREIPSQINTLKNFLQIVRTKPKIY